MRDKLIELIASKVCSRYLKDTCLSKWSGSCGECECGRNFQIGDVADFMLANGVIVLPCKVGDTVYYLDDIVWDSECSNCEHYLIGGFGDPSECMRTRYGNKHPDCIKIIEKVATQHDIYWWIYSKSFGKTVFLTKAEAERALSERRSCNE